MLLDLHADFPGGNSGGLVFPSLEEFSTVSSDPHSQMLWQVNKGKVDIFLELFCFFVDPADVGNLISGFSAFSESSLYICKFMVNALLKPGLENFAHYFASKVTALATVQLFEHSLALTFFGIGMKTDLYSLKINVCMISLCQNSISHNVISLLKRYLLSISL